MSNVYECSDYVITEIYYTPEYVQEDESTWNLEVSENYIVKLQRLPEENYPNLSEIWINYIDVSPTLSKEDWITAALPIINSELTAMDAAFSNSDPTYSNTTSYSTAFSE